MSTPEYQTIITSMVVLPKGEAIFSEQATTIRIEDDGAGPFLVIQQFPDDPPKDGTQQIRIDANELEAIYDVANQLRDVCRLLDSWQQKKDHTPTISSEYPETVLCSLQKETESPDWEDVPMFQAGFHPGVNNEGQLWAELRNGDQPSLPHPDLRIIQRDGAMVIQRRTS